MKLFLYLTGWLLFLSSFAGAQNEPSIRSSVTRVINGETFCVHEVRRKQTLYSISKAYEVEMQVIIDRNPEIRSGLKTGQILLIPCPGEAKQSKPVPVIPEPLVPDPENFGGADSLAGTDYRGEGFHSRNTPCYSGDSHSRQTFRVALMMHLYLKEAKSLISGEVTDLQESADFPSFRYLQFYEGFLLAVDSLKKLGLNLDLYVYDVEPGGNGIDKVLDKPELKQMDLIIGMLFHRDFQAVASWANRHQIPLVSPISEREAQVEGNPSVIKVRPPNSSAATALIDFLSREYPYGHTLIVRSWEPEVREIADQAYTEGLSRGLDVTIVGEDQLTSQFLPEARNLIVVVTRQQSFAMNLLSRLNADTALLAKYTLFGLPRWDEMDGIDYEFLEKSNTHFVLPWFIDYGNPGIDSFVKLFQNTYKTDPDVIAFQGYDVAWYFLSALREFGPDFQDCLPGFRIRPMLSDYQFFNQRGNGWENRYWGIYRFNHYSIQRLY